jgi:hypothetical protein
VRYRNEGRRKEDRGETSWRDEEEERRTRKEDRRETSWRDEEEERRRRTEEGPGGGRTNKKKK